MFSISIIVLLSSCSIYKYEEFDLTLDNDTDYFNRLEFEKVEIDGARFFQEDKTSITLSTLFAVDEYKISNYYYDNVVFSFQVNLRAVIHDRPFVIYQDSRLLSGIDFPSES